MTTLPKHEGWSNYPTWAVALWANNSQTVQRVCLESARRARNEAPTSQQVKEEIWTAEQAERFILADRLKVSVEARLDGLVKNDLLNSPFADLVTWSLGQVNWDEWAESWLGMLDEGVS